MVEYLYNIFIISEKFMHTPDRITQFIFLLLILLCSGCATLPKNVDRPESYSLSATGDTFWGRIQLEEKTAHPGKSGFILLGNGLDAFTA